MLPCTDVVESFGELVKSDFQSLDQVIEVARRLRPPQLFVMHVVRKRPGPLAHGLCYERHKVVIKPHWWTQAVEKVVMGASLVSASLVCGGTACRPG
jgi:hypothetical protein